MSVLKTKNITLLTISVITLFTILFTGCGNKMPKKVYKIYEINFSNNGEKTTKNYGFQEIGNENLTYYSDNEAEYDDNGKLIRDHFFANTYDVSGNLVTYDCGGDDRIVLERHTYNVKYDKKAKKITVTTPDEKSFSAIYKYDDSGKLVYYKVSSLKKSDIYLQYDYSIETGKISKITYYSKVERETDPHMSIARHLFQWDYFSTFNFNNYN